MLDRIKDILATIGIGIVILFLCAVFVTRVSWLGVFIISALYIAVHIYCQITDSGKSKADGIMFSGIYVVLIIMSLYQYSVDSKKIEQTRKKALMYNAAISTGFCIAGGYAINGAIEKPAEKFIRNFSKANKNSPKLEKYIEGIKVVRPALILGGLYYIVIPLISTFLADRFDGQNSKKSNM